MKIKAASTADLIANELKKMLNNGIFSDGDRLVERDPTNRSNRPHAIELPATVINCHVALAVAANEPIKPSETTSEIKYGH